MTRVQMRQCSRRRVSGAIRSLVNARGLQLEYARVKHKTACSCSYVWQSDINMKGGGEI